MPDLAPLFYPIWLALLSLGQVVTYLRKPGTDASAALDAAQQSWAAERAQLQRDLHDLRVRLEHTAASEELIELEGTVRELAERTRGMSESLGLLVKGIERVESFLMHQRP